MQGQQRRRPRAHTGKRQRVVSANDAAGVPGGPSARGHVVGIAPGENLSNREIASWHLWSTLARLLAQYRGRRNHLELPRLSYRKILAWADAHQQRTGAWPNVNSAPIPEAPRETWKKIDQALRAGLRKLRGGESLAQLLTRNRGLRNPARLSDLTVDQVLEWADAYYQQTGRWPTMSSGLIAGSNGETWRGVDWALRDAKRGLPASYTLPQLLAERRGARNRASLPSLVPEMIVSWARAHQEHTGRKPSQHSGPVLEAPGEIWSAIDACLRQGHRGFPGGSSLPQFLTAHGLPAAASNGQCLGAGATPVPKPICG